MPSAPTVVDRRGRWASLAPAILLGLAAGAAGADEPAIVSAELGLGGAYKIGKWAPLRVTIGAGDASAGALDLIAVTPDNDGVGVATTPPGRRPVGLDPIGPTQSTAYVRVGRRGGRVEVRLLRNGRELASKQLPLESSDPAAIAAGLAAGPATPATETLWLGVGPEVGLASALQLAIRDQPWRESGVAAIRDAAELPTDTLGYDAFDAVVLVAGEWTGSLTPDDPRVRRLREWVERGGRLVLSCGRLGPELLADGGALAGLAPVGYEGPLSLKVADTIEAYAQAPPNAGRIELSGASLTVSRLSADDGVARVLASAGRGEGATPLVVRSPVGFGEVTCVAFDLDAAPILRWEGRASLLARLLGVAVTEGEGRRGYAYGDELTDSVVSRLDRTLAEVWSPPFLLIVGLTIAYLLLIGPGDYLFVKRVIGRVEATWITFPAIVVVTSAAAYGAAYWLKGDRVRVNQWEVIDVDATEGLTRGLLLTHVFSPRADRYDVSLVAREPSGEPYADRLDATDTAWFARTGGGLGGMGGGTPADGVARGLSIGYRVDPAPLLSPQPGPTVAGLPIPVWSAKTLVSRYAGRTDRTAVAELAATDDGLVTGAVTNDTGAKLTDCQLLFGRWAWKLGDLADGQTATIDSDSGQVSRKTMLASLADRRRASLGDLAVRLSLSGATQPEGDAQNRVTRASDLTPHLDAGRAVLLAELVRDEPCSELVRLTGSGEPAPLAPVVSRGDSEEAPAHQSWVFVRYLLPVDGG